VRDRESAAVDSVPANSKGLRIFHRGAVATQGLIDDGEVDRAALLVSLIGDRKIIHQLRSWSGADLNVGEKGRRGRSSAFGVP